MAEWIDTDQRWAQLLGEALELEPGQQVEHFVIGMSVGSGQVDGKPRMVFVTTCCRDCKQPTHLMEHVIEILGGRN